MVAKVISCYFGTIFLIPEFDYFDTLTQLNNVFHLFIFQIEEGDVFYVAGGLLVEHPLTSPLVEAIVSVVLAYPASWFSTENRNLFTHGTRLTFDKLL